MTTPPKKQKLEEEETFFKKIGEQADGVVEATGDAPGYEVESLCMACGKNGTTRFLMTDIPYFKEIILQSFECPHCGTRNSTIQSAGAIQDLGVQYKVDIKTRHDLDRRVVKSETCLVSIPEFELQIPGSKGQLTTVEGLLADTIEDLSADQDTRKESQPEAYEIIDKLISRFKKIIDFAAGQEPEAAVVEPFTLIVSDAAGNSFVEAYGGFSDHNWSKQQYERSQAQNEALGLVEQEQQPEVVNVGPDEVITFQGQCRCGATNTTNMKAMNIPHFKDVIIASTFCDECGYRDNEVKAGGPIAPLAKRITLKVTESDDLSRDILKSETAGLTIPELELELQPGTLGGRFTTLEGLLTQVYEELDQRAFVRGDTRTGEDNNVTRFLNKLRGAIAVEFPFTVILDDPLSNSYIQSLYAPDPDPNMEELDYPRTHLQNDELGLNDIDVN